MVIDPAGHRSAFTYAATGFQNMQQGTIGARVTSYTPDAYGRISQLTAPDGAVTTLAYDALNRVSRRVGLTFNDTTTYSYDNLYLTKVRDAAADSVLYGANALGWVTSRTDPTGHVSSYGYDKNGNRTTAVNRRGQSVSFTYDALDDLTTRVADGRTSTFATDPLGGFVAASNAESTDTIYFDPAGRPATAATWRGGTRYVLASLYNNLEGVRYTLKMTAPFTRQIVYGYDVNEQLDSLVDLAGGLTTVGYNAELLADTYTLPNGLVVTRSFPSTHETAQVTYSNTTVNGALGLELGYNTAGQVDRHMNVAEDSVRAFLHDRLGRLAQLSDSAYTSMTCNFSNDTGFNNCTGGGVTWKGTTSYAYDKVGNRTDSGASVQVGDRLTAFDGYTLGYDADGNLTSKSGNGVSQTLYWNSLGQLDSVNANGTMVRFGYDGLGRRVRKTVGSTTTTAVYDGVNLFMELDGSGQPLREYTYYPGVDRPHSMVSGGAVYYYATDFPGNVLGLVSSTNSVVNQYRYKPFGKSELASEGVTNPLHYAARYLDTETGLYYDRARYYDPSLARFVSQDPIGLAGGINPYAYVGNDPVDARDPFGACKNGVPTFKFSDGGVEIDDCRHAPPESSAGPPGIGAPRRPGGGSTQSPCPNCGGGDNKGSQAPTAGRARPTSALLTSHNSASTSPSQRAA